MTVDLYRDMLALVPIFKEIPPLSKLKDKHLPRRASNIDKLLGHSSQSLLNIGKAPNANQDISEDLDMRFHEINLAKKSLMQDIDLKDKQLAKIKKELTDVQAELKKTKSMLAINQKSYFTL